MSGNRQGYARLAGTTLLVAVLSVAILHIGPSVISGPKRATGTSDLGVISAYYAHSAVLPFLWQGGISVIAIILFAVSFRRYLSTFALPWWGSCIADLATCVAIAVTPLYALSAALESAMVQLVAAGHAGQPGLLGVFAAWDWSYNSFAYFFEAAYMGGWAIVAWRSRALPRWLAAVGGVTALGHLFNSQVLISHLADELTLLPTALFLVWFLGTGIYLARGGEGSANSEPAETGRAARVATPT